MQIVCQSEFFLKWFIYLLSATNSREGNHAHSGSVPECGHHEDRCPDHDDHRLRNKKQRLSVRQVEVPMSQMGRMCFVAAGVVMEKQKEPNSGNPCIGAPTMIGPVLTGRTAGRWSAGEGAPQS